MSLWRASHCLARRLRMAQRVCFVLRVCLRKENRRKKNALGLQWRIETKHEDGYVIGLILKSCINDFLWACVEKEKRK
jgi:hypothetical protein